MAYDGPIPLGTPSGGTGRATITSGAVISGNGSGNVLVSNQGSAGYVFICQTASTSGQYIQPTAGTGLTITTNASTLSYALTNPSGFPWTDVTGATQTLAVNNGYITDHADVTYTLPASASIGDRILIVGKLGIATITPNANQQILIGTATGTVGATGTAVATNASNCIELTCVTSGSSTVYRARNFEGNWTLT